MGRRTVSDLGGRIGAAVIGLGLGENPFLDFTLLWLLRGCFAVGGKG